MADDRQGYVALVVGGPIAGTVFASERRTFIMESHAPPRDGPFWPLPVSRVAYRIDDLGPRDGDDPDRRVVYLAFPDGLRMDDLSQPIKDTLFVLARSLGCVGPPHRDIACRRPYTGRIEAPSFAEMTEMDDE